jgi:hypothetical protein
MKKRILIKYWENEDWIILVEKGNEAGYAKLIYKGKKIGIKDEQG